MKAFSRKEPPSWRAWEKLPEIAFKSPSGERLRQTLQAWRRQRIQVLIGIDDLEFRGEKRPQHTLSVCTWAGTFVKERVRSTDAEVAIALRDFGMGGAEEDNHQPGVIRMFFLLADLRPGEEGVQCECKADEQLVVEPDGFRWSRTKVLRRAALARLHARPPAAR